MKTYYILIFLYLFKIKIILYYNIFTKKKLNLSHV